MEEKNVKFNLTLKPPCGKSAEVRHQIQHHTRPWAGRISLMIKHFDVEGWIWTLFICHAFVCFQPVVGQDGSLTRLNRGLFVCCTVRLGQKKTLFIICVRSTWGRQESGLQCDSGLESPEQLELSFFIYRQYIFLKFIVIICGLISQEWL